MKIYPNKHQIVSIQNINLNTDVPLAFIDTKSTDYDVNVVSFLQKNERQEVIPYSYFDSYNVCFFDKNNNKIPGASYLERDGAKYKFKPELVPGTSSFVPLDFSYNIVGKRNSSYRSDNQYNLKISCVDNLPDLQLSNKLIPLFGNAPDRGLCPSNISVNNKNKTLQLLTNSAVRDNDFIFIESSNGNQYKKYWTAGIQYNANETVYYDGQRYRCTTQHTSALTWGDDQKNDSDILFWEIVSDMYDSSVDTNIELINDYLQYNTNVWICSEDYINCQKSSAKTIVSVTNPVAIKIDNMQFDYGFDISSMVQTDNVIIHNIFNSNIVPVLIYEYIDKGFVIVTPKEFMNNINQYADLFYEVLMQVYLKAYIQSTTYNDWIADMVPTYIVSNGKLIQKEKFTTRNEIYKMFGLPKGELQLIDVLIDQDKYPYVTYDGLINDFIVFKKVLSGDNAKYADKCNWDGITIYTEGKIIMMQDFTYTIEESVSDKITWKIDNGKIYFNIKPFKSSINNIDSTFSMLSTDLAYDEFIVSSLNLYICYSSTLNIVRADMYDQSYGIKIAEIQISKQKADNVIFDMRQLGGGLPEDATPDYDMLDIGHINGKPYRKGGTLVITVPARLKPYEDLIIKAVKKHMVAEEFPIILFE